MAGRGESNNLPFVSYQDGSGADEVLRPTLMTVSDGRSYRKITEATFGPEKRERKAATRPAVYIEEDECGLDNHLKDGECEEEEDLSKELEGLERSRNGGFLYRMDIPEVFYKYIIGRQGKTKSLIEKDTWCRIQVPRQGVKGDVIIEGRSEKSIVDAKRRLEMIVWSNRLRERVTHFISIPLNHPALMDKLKLFQEEVMSKCSKDAYVCDETFQIPEKFHVTVGVMRLFSREEEERAIKVMKESLEHSIAHLGSEPAVVKVQGIDCMNDDPSAVKVLFAKLHLTDSSNRLQQLVDSITHYFYTNAPDLMTNEFGRDSVKLHATIMNVKFYAKHHESKEGGSKDTGRERSRKKVVIDATNVIKEFGEFDFGELPLEVLHLSKIGDYGPDGFYKCIKKFQLSSFLKT